MTAQYLILLICTMAAQTLGNSDIDTTSNTKSGDMPASVVLLLLFMFIALGFIGIRHIRRDYLQQQSYIMAKKAGAIFNTGPSKSYGSTLSPKLNQNNIDDYIDDQLYGDWNNAILDRLNHYRQSLQRRFINYMEQTPEPVMFEANPDRSVGAYCKNPEIPSNPNYNAQSYQHVHDAQYDATPSDALQTMFQANYERNKAKTQKQDERKEYGQIEDMMDKNRRRAKHCDIEYHEENNNDNEYDVIPDTNAYSDSDRDISDSDNGNTCHEPLVTKVVVLDLD
eukprot:138926_1